MTKDSGESDFADSKGVESDEETDCSMEERSSEDDGDKYESDFVDQDDGPDSQGSYKRARAMRAAMVINAITNSDDSESEE